ncbi:MAG: histone deacetylase [Thermodesulfobacteriota bacterium]
MKPTGIVTDPIYLKHEMGPFHPESPQRLEVIYSRIDSMCNGGSPGLNLVRIRAREATHEEIGSNHAGKYIERIRATAGVSNTFLDADTSTCQYSWEAATKAVGGLLNLVDAVAEGKVRNGFAFVRPPGHHAEWARAMGFCLFNNVAIAARYARDKHGMQKVAIVDWDLHHGNGTQNAFFEDPGVLFLSTHESPMYPGSGAVDEVGRGQGEGYTVNVPLPAGCGDPEYVTIFSALALPVLRAYAPDMILVSSGFDAHRRDPLGGMAVTEEGYDTMIRMLMEVASEVCAERVVLSLEGGYDLTALENSAASVLRRLATYEPTPGNDPPQPPVDQLVPQFQRRARSILSAHQRYWPTVLSI